MGHLTLREYQTEPRVRLSAEERDALISSMPSLTVTPSVGLEGHYDLTPSSHVGAVEVGSLSVTVAPKIPVSRVMFLISYALDPANWSWWEGGRCAFVSDVKYKALPERGVVHPDLYQLLSYVIACDLPGGLLVYGSGGDAVTHHIERAGKSLEVVSLDLSSPPERILRSMGDLANRVRALRAEASKARPNSMRRRRTRRNHLEDVRRP